MNRKKNKVLIAAVSVFLALFVASTALLGSLGLPGLPLSGPFPFGHRPPFNVSSFGHPPSFTLEFPASADLGELWLIEDMHCFTCGTGQRNLGRATDKHFIRLPAAHWFISLRMPKNASKMLPFLAHPSLINIGDIDLERSDVKDDDLKHIAGIHLKSINLSGTQITGAGLKHLRPNSENTKPILVDLRDCPNLDLRYLAHFKDWKRSAVSLVGHKWGEEYTDEEKRLLGAARRIICDGQPANVCGVRIE